MASPARQYSKAALVPHVVMLAMSDIVRDARVRREATALAAAGYRVTVVGDQQPEHAEPVVGLELAWARQRTSGAWRRRPPRVVRWLLLPEHRQRTQRAFQRHAIAVAERAGPADIVHAHDLPALAPAHELSERWGAKLVYDAHECWTGRRLEGRPAPLRRWRDRQSEQRKGAATDLVVTVSSGIAMWMEQRYGWERVAVVRNSFPQHPTAEPVDRPRGLLYAGRIDHKRDLETMVAAAPQLSGLRLTVIGPSDDPALARRLAEGLDVHPPIGITELGAWYRDHGLGLIPLTDDSLNHRLALPNKLFQAVQAGVPVVAADLPEMARVVREHGIGTLYRPGDTDSLVRAVCEAIDSYRELTANVHLSAAQLSWERDEEILLDAYDRLCEAT